MGKHNVDERYALDETHGINSDFEVIRSVWPVSCQEVVESAQQIWHENLSQLPAPEVRNCIYCVLGIGT